MLRIFRSTRGYQPLAISEAEGGPADEVHDVSPLDSKVEELAPLTVRQTAEIGFAFCWLYFIANWAINAALNYTTVASSSIMASTSGGSYDL